MPETTTTNMSNLMQVARNYWLQPLHADPDTVRELAAATTLPEEFCHLLVQRGVTDKEAARAFLKPTMAHLHDPFLMKGMKEMVDRLIAARERGDKIGIHGDYDVDGLTSTTLYTVVLRKLGFDVTPFVPHRMIDGYGVATRALGQFQEQGIKVVLTCDTGFSAVDEVRQAIDEMGMEVLITDHHLPPNGELPKAHALVNPHQEGCGYPFKPLCGAGVAYKVLQGLCRTMGVDEKEVLEPHIDLAAIGTVADIVPLVGENRAIVRAGIHYARQTRNLGLRVLCDTMGVPPQKLDEGKFGWWIGPRLNAAGRISDAGKGLNLLLAEKAEEATAIAQEIEALNEERKKLTRAIENDAVSRIEKMDLEDVYGIVLCGEHGADPEWHHGVIGIVASWVKERYTRAVLLMAWDPESQRYKGSGRAPKVAQVHLKKALDACAEHLEKHGGHAAAAGFTVKGTSPAEIDAFASAFNEAVKQQMSAEDRIPRLEANMELTLDKIDDRLHKALQWLQPFGEENESVRMLARGVTVKRLWTLKTKPGGQGLKMEVEQNGRSFQALSWDLLDAYPELIARETPFEADLIFQLKENDWKKRRDPFADVELEMELKDMRLPHTIPLPLEARLNEERRKTSKGRSDPEPEQPVKKRRGKQAALSAS